MQSVHEVHPRINSTWRHQSPERPKGCRSEGNTKYFGLLQQTTKGYFDPGVSGCFFPAENAGKSHFAISELK